MRLSKRPTGSPDRPRGLPGVLASAALLATLGCNEALEAPTSPEAVEPSLAVSAAAALPTFTFLATGGDHTCALASDRRAYCWGENGEGQLGDGTNTDRLTPVPVAGGERFLQINAGAEHTCGITTNERAFCWGAGAWTPVAVPGNRRFRNVTAGNNHTCAVTPEDVGFCWGWNNYHGQLGTGGGYSLTPARIAGGHRWRRVSAGGQYTCGVTTDFRAYCWGWKVGNKPVAVPGGLRFRQVNTGGGGFDDSQELQPVEAHACGITREDRAYCWDAFRTPTVTAVAGNRRWRQVDAGMFHTCGVTEASRAFCWGYNAWGYNGNGTTSHTRTRAPERVAGGIAFANIDTGVMGRHTCGLTSGGKVYCWGANDSGQLGDGTQTQRLVPVAVVGGT